MATESGLRRRVKGLSEVEFRQRYGTETQCRSALFQLRWGKGWACPGCGHGGYAELKGRAVYQCNRCKRQVGLTAGTVFHWTIDRSAVDPVPQRRGLVTMGDEGADGLHELAAAVALLGPVDHRHRLGLDGYAIELAVARLLEELEAADALDQVLDALNG